jgi:hypothetical protein
MTSTPPMESTPTTEDDSSIVNTIRYDELIRRIEKFVRDYDIDPEIDDGESIPLIIYRDSVLGITTTSDPQHIIYDDKRVTEVLDLLKTKETWKYIGGCGDSK